MVSKDLEGQDRALFEGPVIDQYIYS